MHILVTILADEIRLGDDIPGPGQIGLLHTMRSVIVHGLLAKSILSFSYRLKRFGIR